MQTKLEKRDLEFENLLGNLLIAEYQVEKLRERISQNLSTDFSNTGKVSESVFKYKNNWYRITLKVDQIDLNGKNQK
ncbi:MAG: hypothetical protein ACM3JQ_00335 [Candidatus Eiseniibacteriota bacterium]|jgi:hypothetical protein